MSFFKKLLLVLMLVSLSSVTLVMAKDISDEQYQVRMAQKEYESARSDYESINQQIQQYEQRITQLSAQLDPLKKTLPAKQERFNKAKANLEEKTNLLDKAWEENKKN